MEEGMKSLKENVQADARASWALATNAVENFGEFKFRIPINSDFKSPFPLGFVYPHNGRRRCPAPGIILLVPFLVIFPGFEGSTIYFSTHSKAYKYLKPNVIRIDADIQFKNE